MTATHTHICQEHGVLTQVSAGPIKMVPHSIACTLIQIERQAEEEHAECLPELEQFAAELGRVRETFGVREAMEFGLEHFEITPLAFLTHFGLMEQGEHLGVFAL